DVGAWPVLDWLIPAYLLPATLAGYALMRPETEQPPWLRRILGLYALVAGFTWVTLEVRHLFHRQDIQIGIFKAGVEDAELWAWSAAWIVYGSL
ncbi:DUF2339 domain-containing protein, partial [Klebsiella pneumoniae]|nr:DUF2339 domain-containing protein [Klebsiella pneumoniae]